jgi:hypothetical protein
MGSMFRASATHHSVTDNSVIRASGANSISMGRTPHEHRDEMCRRVHS